MNRFCLLAPLVANCALVAHAETYVDSARVRKVQQDLTGYQVAYDYRGQQFLTLLAQDPGPRKQVRVSVEPLTR